MSLFPLLAAMLSTHKILVLVQQALIGPPAFEELGKSFGFASEHV